VRALMEKLAIGRITTSLEFDDSIPLKARIM
jgi:hypothetical protein